jgi:hypothetical protein
MSELITTQAGVPDTIDVDVERLMQPDVSFKIRRQVANGLKAECAKNGTSIERVLRDLAEATSAAAYAEQVALIERYADPMRTCIDKMSEMLDAQGDSKDPNAPDRYRRFAQSFAGVIDKWSGTLERIKELPKTQVESGPKIGTYVDLRGGKSTESTIPAEIVNEAQDI